MGLEQSGEAQPVNSELQTKSKIRHRTARTITKDKGNLALILAVTYRLPVLLFNSIEEMHCPA